MPGYVHKSKTEATLLSCRENKRSWFYRIRPSVTHEPFHPLDFPVEQLTGLQLNSPDVSANCAVYALQQAYAAAGDFDRGVITPNQLRWRPFAIPSDSVDFVRGLTTICGAGSSGKKDGFAIHVYTASVSMHNTCLANADGDMLIVPQQGEAPCAGGNMYIAKVHCVCTHQSRISHPGPSCINC